MAPEQAAGRIEQIDPRTDVYGLGAILYEILTGQPPFSGANTREILSRVCADDPVAPRQLVSQTPPALESVCGKAMAKKPEDRYASAEALAQDVRRWLADEPVAAYRDPWPARLRRWLSRHRTFATSAAAALLVTVLSLSLLTALLGAANRRERQAKDQARENFRLARQTVEKYCVQVSEDLRLRQEDLRPLRKELLQNAAEFLKQLKDKPGDDAEVRRDRGRALKQLAYLTDEIGSPEEAIRYDTEARNVWEDLLQLTHSSHDKFELAASIYHLGLLYSRTGRLPQAEAALNEALAAQRLLTESYPDDPRYRDEQAVTLNSLALLYANTQQGEKAEEIHREALALRQKLCAEFANEVKYQRGLAQTYDNLAILYRNQGPKRLAEAEEAFEKALALHRTVLADQPGNARYQSELGKCSGNLAILYLYRKEEPRAERAYQEAIDLDRQLVIGNPSVIDYRTALASDLHNLANLYRYTDRFDRAEEAYKESLAIRKKLAEMQPTVPNHQMSLGRSYNNLGILLEQRGKPEQARDSFLLAVAVQKRLAETQGKIVSYGDDLVRSYHNLAESYSTTGDFSRAESIHQEIVTLHRKQIDERPGDAEALLELANDYNRLAKLMNQKGDNAAALAWTDRAMTILEPILNKFSDPKDAREVASATHRIRARALTSQKKIGEALRAWDQAVESAPRQSRAPLRLGRAGTLAQSGQHAQAAAEADAIVQQGQPGGGVLYNAACVQALAAAATQQDGALTSAEQHKRAEKYNARAVGLLEQARQMGFFRDKTRIALMKADKDLKALRDNAEFKRLISELEAKR
jgi:tetratricopeptide (TPR) repeat protein